MRVLIPDSIRVRAESRYFLLQVSTKGGTTSGFDAGPNFYAYVSDQPTMWGDASGLSPSVQHLSDCVRDLLKKYFPSLDFDKVQLVKDPGLYVPFTPNAITIGNTIDYKPGYFNGTVTGIGDIAHELVHVEQYQKSGGIVPFLKKYSRDVWKNGYKRSGAETEASNKEDEVEYDLIKRFGYFGEPCKDYCK